MASTTDRVQTIDLDHAQLLVLTDRHRDRVRVLFGGRWLTEGTGVAERGSGAGLQPARECRGQVPATSPGRALAQALEAVRALRRARSGRRLLARGLAARSLAAMLALVLSLGLPELLARGFLGRLDGAQGHRVSHLAAPSPVARSDGPAPVRGRT